MWEGRGRMEVMEGCARRRGRSEGDGGRGWERLKREVGGDGGKCEGEGKRGGEGRKEIKSKEEGRGKRL